MAEIVKVPLDLIDDPRKEIRTVMVRENLEQLADSIKRFGLIQPVVLKRVGERYEVIVGHRRTLASRMAGLIDIPAIVREGAHADDEALKLEENVVREDVNPMDVARFVAYTMEREALSEADVARRFNKSPAWVTYMVRLLETDPIIQAGVEAGQIAYASALELQKIENPVARETYTKAAITGGASHRTILGWVQQYKGDEEFRKRVESGEYKEPATFPYHPLEARCWLCDRFHDSNEMISLKVGPQCFDWLRDVPKVYRKDYMEKEAGHGKGNQPKADQD